MNVKANTATTKIAKLTGSNVSALEGWAEELRVDLGKTTATFEGTAKEAATRVRTVQEKIAAVQGRQSGPYSSLHAVARKLENGDCKEAPAPADETPVAPAEEAPAETPETAKLTLVVDSTDKNANPGGVFGQSVEQAVAEETAKRTASKPNAMGDTPTWGTAKTHGLKDGDMFMYYGRNAKAPKDEGTVRKYEAHTGGNSNMGGYATRFWFARIVPIAEQRETAAAAKKAAPTAKKAPAKKSAGARTIPAEAAHKSRQEWIAANGGLDAYKKGYNSGWDNATYGTGEKRAASGEAPVAWMDGYTDRKANPGKEGIAAKWDALRSNKAPAKKA
jgi:hypothetical protein